MAKFDITSHKDTGRDCGDAAPREPHSPSSAESVNAIKQRFDGDEQRKDCFLCSAAMAAGITYEQAWDALDDTLRACFGPKGRGPMGDQCDKILSKLGFERVRVGARTGDPSSAPGDYFVLFMLPEYATSGFLRNVLWGRRALLQVPSKNYPGEQHIIYWDGRELFDPSNKRAWEWQEVEPIYVWLFDERRARIPNVAQPIARILEEARSGLMAYAADAVPQTIAKIDAALATLASQPPAAPVEIPGLTIDAIHKQALRMHPADQHKLAEMIAANVGYELTPEPPHPDCPHERSSAATEEEIARIVSKLRNFAIWNNRHSHYEPVPLCKEAADLIERIRAVPQTSGETR